MRPPKKELQDKIVKHVNQTFKDFDVLLKRYRQKWYSLFVDTYHFETKRKGDGKSQVFFPKAYEQVEKIAPRITGNDPKFVLDLNYPVNQQIPDANMELNMKAVQMGLNYFWKVGRCKKKARTWAKGGLVAGTAFAKVEFARQTMKTKQKEIVTNKDGDLVEKTTEIEQVMIEYPTFRALDILDCYFDPRIESVDDYSAFIENVDNVSLQDLLDNPEFFNKEELKNLQNRAYSSEGDNYKQNKFNLEGIPSTETSEIKKTNYRVYTGVFKEDEDEKLIEAIVVDGSILVSYKEIEFLPIEKYSPVEIPNQGVGVGVVEPIQKIQDAYNLTRNQRLENVSLVLNRMWLMKQGAGIDPRKLRSAAGNVIAVRDLQDIQPLQTPDVTSSSYSEAQALNTEIQTTLGTIDTAQDNSAGGFTSLATGQKIRWNEYNTRFNAIKANFEDALAALGQKMLMMVGKEALKNPIVKDEVTGRFFEIAKESFNDVSDYFTANVLPDSTAMDSIDNKREESLGFGQLAIAYKAQGVNVPMDQVWKDIVQTFQKDTTIYAPPTPPPQPEQLEQGSGKPVSQENIEGAMPQPSPADQLNQDLTNI